MSRLPPLGEEGNARVPLREAIKSAREKVPGCRIPEGARERSPPIQVAPKGPPIVSRGAIASLSRDMEDVTGQKGFGEWAVRKGYLIVKEGAP